MPIQSIVAVILTFNSEDTILQVINSCRGLASRVLVVDSFSTDDTVSLARSLGCEVVQHAFENYSVQRNWAQSHAQPQPGDWFLHLDSDEVLSPELAQSIRKVKAEHTGDVNGYLVRRLSYFLGSPIRHGHINPSWHLRLFSADKGCCEDRLYDQHFLVTGPTRRLSGLLFDLQLVSLEKWTASHNHWSTAEALEASKGRSKDVDRGARLSGNLRGDIRMKKRWLKNNIWYRCPLLIRSLVFFLYSYFLRLGFLDGKNGLIYHFLQAFWFRFLVDAKIYESNLLPRGKNILPPGS
jgi:glycosyltransferase involved in cell wall biosynthesis